eukprot:m.113887 g.113887  ORF g.113887 m.113887 type:complete len:310 (+) comp16014_c1_seq2:236-1165(+)
MAAHSQGHFNSPLPNRSRVHGPHERLIRVGEGLVLVRRALVVGKEFAIEHVEHDGVGVVARDGQALGRVLVEDVVVDVLWRPVVGRAGEVLHDLGHVPHAREIGALVLVDGAQGVAKLVQHHPLVLVVGRGVAQPAVVHRRLVQREVGRVEGVAADCRPGAGVGVEGDADLRWASRHKLDLHTDILHPLHSDFLDLLLHGGRAVQEAAAEDLLWRPLLGDDDGHARREDGPCGRELLGRRGLGQLRRQDVASIPLGVQIIRDDALMAEPQIVVAVVAVVAVVVPILIHVPLGLAFAVGVLHPLGAHGCE